MTPNPSIPKPAGSQLESQRGINMMGSPEALKMILTTALVSLSDDVPAIGRELAAGDVRAAGRRAFLVTHDEVRASRTILMTTDDA